MSAPSAGPAPRHRTAPPVSPKRRAREWLLTGSPGLVALALAVGAGAGLGAVVFRYLILEFTRVFSGHDDYSAVGRVPNPLVPQLGIWFLLLAPVAGGLIYGLLIDRFAREARGHGVPEVMLAVAERGGRIRPSVAVIKSLASALCIGCGGSVGREGPIVQIGSALGSTVGQVLRVSEARLRLLVACGAAGGISATFNAPIAGVFFALELILRDFEGESFGVVVLASVLADVIGRAAFGARPFLVLPPFRLVSLWEYGLYAGLGLAATVVGLTFIRVLYGAEDLCDRVWRGPEWARPAAGGIVLGLMLFALPQMYGVGYPVLERAVRGDYLLPFLVVLLAGKIAATSLTIGIGGSGGVFAPSLFMGAMAGTAYGELVHRWLPAITGPAGAYGLVGMGSVFAAAAQAPITAVLIIFELTGNYQVILPLMFAIVLAAGLSNLLSRDSIYTLKLRRRGIDIRRGRAANIMEILTVADAMSPVPDPLPRGLPLNQTIARFGEQGQDTLPVADESGTFRGTVTAAEVEDAMRDNALDAAAGDLARETPALRPRQTLEEALRALMRRDVSGLPVLAPGGGRMIGWLTHRDVLRAYNAYLEHGVARAEGDAPAADRAAAAGGGTEPALARLRDYRIVELGIDRDEPPAGRKVRDLSWPPGCLVIAVRRDGAGFVPGGETLLQKGDRLTVLVPAAHADTLVDVVCGPPGPRPGGGELRGREEAGARRAFLPDQALTAPEGSAILEARVEAGSDADGGAVRDLGLGGPLLLVAVHRGENVIVPRGETQLAAGDRVVLIAPREEGERALGIFRRRRARS